MPDAKLSLDAFVTRVAARLMPADAASHVDTVREVLRELVEYLRVDTAFLRYNDHEIGATLLVAEWPPRHTIPDPDPLGVVYFHDAGPLFAASATMKDPLFSRPGRPAEPHQDREQYEARIKEGSGMSDVSMAAVPLVSGQVTTGSLGLIKQGDRAWTDGEVTALKLIAVLLAQVQARIRAEEELRDAAYHDALTGLASRRALFEYLDDRLWSGKKGPVGVLFLDVDRLKALNDFLGHRAADTYLCMIAQRLSEGNGCHDMVARLGGDEFVVVLDGPATLDEVTARAEAMLQQVGESVALDGQMVGRGVSVGVALGEPGEIRAVTLLSWADQAMMSAKNRGGNSVGVFTEDMNDMGKRRTLIEMHLRTSIDDEHLTLDYQPEVDLRTGRVLGVEALVRWNHPVLGKLQPGDFVDVAESTNLAGKLGSWVLDTACARLGEWKCRFRDLDLIMSVNVSPVQLVSMDFDLYVEQVLERHGLLGSELCLEITENVVVGDLRRTRATLSKLERLGVRIAIDDFGTGYSSLGHLKSLPVDTLKIDKVFVQNLDRSEGDRVIINSIVGLASSFGLDVVAEGVESVGAVSYLLDLGCVRAQGFLLSRPKSVEDIERLLEAGVVTLPWNVDRNQDYRMALGDVAL